MSAADAGQLPETIARMFRAIESGDFDGLRTCFTPDGVVWHNIDEKAEDLDAVCTNLGNMVGISDKVAYTDVSTTTVGNQTFAQHVLVADLKSGKQLRLPAMMRIETNDDGLITRIDEYFDSGRLAVLA